MFNIHPALSVRVAETGGRTIDIALVCFVSEALPEIDFGSNICVLAEDLHIQ